MTQRSGGGIPPQAIVLIVALLAGGLLWFGRDFLSAAFNRGAQFAPPTQAAQSNLPAATPLPRAAAPQPATARPTNPPQPSALSPGQTSPTLAKPSQPTQAAPPAPAANGGVPTYKVGIVQFAPYFNAIAAAQLGKQYGVNVEVIDLTGHESEQCADLTSGKIDNLLTTLNATYLCGAVQIVFPVGQSAGTDKMIARSDVKTWNDALDVPMIFAGSTSVSRYMALTLSYYLNRPLKQPIVVDDAQPAADRFEKDPNVKAAVVWEPYAAEALQAVPGSRTLLNSESFRLLWDVSEVNQGALNDPAKMQATAAFTRAWFAALRLQATNHDAYWKLLQDWNDAHKDNTLLKDYTEESLYGELGGEAEASLTDAVDLMDPSNPLLMTRLDEARKVYGAAGEQLPNVPDLAKLLDNRAVKPLAGDPSLLLPSGGRMVNPTIDLGRTPDLSKITPENVSKTRDLADLGRLQLQFQADSDAFANQAATDDLLNYNIKPLMLLTNDTILILRGGYAMPGECKVENGCTEENGKALGLKRAAAVMRRLVALGVPAERIQVDPNLYPPEHRGAPGQSPEAALDRRVGMTLRQVGGGF